MPDTLTELAEQAQSIADRHRQRTETSRGGQPRNESPPVTLDGTTAKIRIYQPIDDWGDLFGLSANELLAEVEALPSNIDTIELAINSPGGMVFEAIAMMNGLRRHEARIVAVVDGLAASAASFIAASADETIMMPNSQMMIHAPFGGCYGDATDMREMAEVLDALALTICEVYEAKSGTPAAEWLDMMAGVDVWISAEHAVELGLADRVGVEPEPELENAAGTPPAAQIDDQPTAGVEAQQSILTAELELLAL